MVERAAVDKDSLIIRLVAQQSSWNVTEVPNRD
jgi:hypothetical protein